MSNELMKLVGKYMLTEQEMFDIAEATKQDEPGSTARSIMWILVPCGLFFAFIVALIVLSYS